MKIAIINASSQKQKNALLFDSTVTVVSKQGHEVINLGIFPEEEGNYSYIQMALCTSILLSSGAVNFVVTGCSSGTGMMLACNSLPDVLCGYITNPTEAFLFGRINDGNAVSFPLGLNFGWSGEVNLKYTLEKLFEEPFGMGYPPEDVNHKQKDAMLLKEIKSNSQKKLVEILPTIEDGLIHEIVARDIFYKYVMIYGKDTELKALLKTYR